MEIAAISGTQLSTQCNGFNTAILGGERNEYKLWAF